MKIKYLKCWPLKCLLTYYCCELQIDAQSTHTLEVLTVLFNSARYTFEASSTLVKEANVGQKNKSVTGNTGQRQNSAEHHFTGEYILQFLYRQQLHRREEETMFVTTC